MEEPDDHDSITLEDVMSNPDEPVSSGMCDYCQII